MRTYELASRRSGPKGGKPRGWGLETTRFEASGGLRSPWVGRGVVSGDGQAETVAGPLQRGVACVRYPRPPAARGGCKQLVRASWCVLGYEFRFYLSKRGAVAGRRSARAVAAAGRARRARVRALRRMHARGSCEAIGAPFRPPAAPTAKGGDRSAGDGAYRGRAGQTKGRLRGPVPGAFERARRGASIARARQPRSSRSRPAWAGWRVRPVVTFLPARVVS